MEFLHTTSLACTIRTLRWLMHQWPFRKTFGQWAFVLSASTGVKGIVPWITFSDASTATTQTWDHIGWLKHATMVLSSSSRSPMTTAVGLRDMEHPECQSAQDLVTPVLQSITMQRLQPPWSKALERQFVLWVPHPQWDSHRYHTCTHIWLHVQWLSWGQMQHTICLIRLGPITKTRDSWLMFVNHSWNRHTSWPRDC